MPHLFPDKAGQERSDPPVGHEWLGHPSDPDVNVVWSPIKRYELLCQLSVVQDGRQLSLVLWLGEAAEPAPGIVSWQREDRKEL